MKRPFLSLISKFRFVPVLMLALLITSAPALAESDPIVHFTYASHHQEWADFLNVMAERFEAKTGIKVEVEVGPSGGAYREQVLVRTAGGMAPDVTDFNPGQAAFLIENGMFEDLRPYVERDGLDMSQFPPVAIEGMTAPDGTMWGLPMGLFPISVYFNVDMFAQAGIANPKELGEDWTWETYLESAQRLTLTDADGNVLQFGTIDPRYRWQILVHQAGGSVYDRQAFPSESWFNTPEVLEAVEFRQALWHAGTISNHGGVWNGAAAISMVDGPTVFNRQVGDFEMDVALMARGPASRSTLVNPDGFQIHQDSTNKEAAWQWIRFLVTEIENQMEFAAITGRLPSQRDAMVRYHEIPRALPVNWYSIIEATFDPAAHAPYVVPNLEMTSVVDQVMNRIWRGEVAPQVGLEQIHEQLVVLLQQ